MLTQFRPTQSSDLKQILYFNLDRTELFYFSPSIHYPLTLEQLQQLLSKSHESTTMLEDKKIIGFANFYNVVKHNIGFIGNIIISPEKRRQGFGKKLIQSTLDSGFNQLQLKEIHLSCYKTNKAALELYSQLGFRVYAQEVRKDENNSTTELFHLKLKK